MQASKHAWIVGCCVGKAVIKIWAVLPPFGGENIECPKSYLDHRTEARQGCMSVSHRLVQQDASLPCLHIPSVQRCDRSLTGMHAVCGTISN